MIKAQANTIEKPERVVKLLGPNMSDKQVDKLMSMGDAEKRFAILTLSAMLAKANGQLAQGQPSESTPSGCTPPHLKPNQKKTPKRGKPVGAPGSRRETPVPNKHVKLELKVCPICGGTNLVKAKGSSAKRTRIVEDIQERYTPEITQFELPRYYCPDCHNRVEAKPVDVLPYAQLGNRLLTTTAWLHYIVGATLSQIVDTFSWCMNICFTASALTQMWSRCAGILKPWYESIHQGALNAAVVHADETSWRVSGQTFWLWRFTT